MRNSILALILFCLWGPLNLLAQTQRLVLLEHFTQASCGPCASYNPAVQALLNANPDKITSIKYQTSWPGTDPMNLHNPQDVAARVSFYGGGFGVPYSVIDGNYYNGHPANWNVNTINSRYAMPSPFEMQFQHWLSAGQDSIYVLGLVKASSHVVGNLAVMVGVIENLIQFTTAPGSNGETSFHHVMKKLLPNPTGTPLPGVQDSGDYVIFQGSWKLANVYNKAQLGVIAWVQDRTTKEVHQAVVSTTTPVISPYSLDVSLQKVLGVGESWCMDEVAPRVVIRNQGNTPLTSAEIRYSVNGAAPLSYNWTGNLGFLDQTEIALPTSSIILGNSNSLSVFLQSANGQTDHYPKNDTMNMGFSKAPETTNPVYFFMRTDNKPQETTWDLKDEQGNVLYSGGPYTQAGKIIQQTFQLSETGCYTFRLHDAGGDGICCTSGYGVYQITSNIPNQVLGEGDNFGTEAIHAFFISDNIGIEEPVWISHLQLTPNPASDMMQLSFNAKRAQEVKITITDLLGRELMQVHSGLMEMGRHELRIATGHLSPGMYLLQMLSGDSPQSLKFQIVY